MVNDSINRADERILFLAMERLPFVMLDVFIVKVRTTGPGLFPSVLLLDESCRRVQGRMKACRTVINEDCSIRMTPGFDETRVRAGLPYLMQLHRPASKCVWKFS